MIIFYFSDLIFVTVTSCVYKCIGAPVKKAKVDMYKKPSKLHPMQATNTPENQRMTVLVLDLRP
jgi:hypothetical protein